LSIIFASSYGETVKKEQSSATTLDVSKGIGYGLLYHAVIGTQSKDQYPYIVQFKTSLPFFSRK